MLAAAAAAQRFDRIATDRHDFDRLAVVEPHQTITVLDPVSFANIGRNYRLPSSGDRCCDNASPLI
jgi:hypothetical protein